ncbi:MAG: Ldh family oxidoreductase, partial [Anaerolineae bacterium]|nr:Ldh family oxidoreductase [Anaerolineae bacterium]
QDDQNFDVGHMMVAINPTAMMSQADFDRRLEELLSQVKNAPPIDSARPVMLPGEVEFGRMEQRRAGGIPVSRETVAQLRDLAAEIGVKCSL